MNVQSNIVVYGLICYDNNMSELDLTPFHNALDSLKEVIDLYKKDTSDKILRDSLIQRFEYSYSLALKMIKRYFVLSAFENGNIDGMTFNEMIRAASRMELLKSDLPVWNDYRLKRNLTSHTYDENTAQKVVSIIPDFYEDATYLLSQLQEKLK